MASNRQVRSPSTSRRAATSANRLDEVLNLQQAFSPPRPPPSARRVSMSRPIATSPPRMDSPASVTEEQTPLASISSTSELVGDGNGAGSPSFRSLSNFGATMISNTTISNTRATNPSATMSLPPNSILNSPAQPAASTTFTFIPRVVHGENQSTRQTPRSLRSTLNINTRTLSATPASSNMARATASSSGNRISLPTPPTSFRRPTYLDNSCLSELLISEIPPSQPLNRFRYDQPPQGISGDQRYKTGSLQSRGDESEEEVMTDSRQIPGLAGTLNPPPNGALRLPTRWSTGDHSSDLSISEDGTVLSFNGPPSNTDKDAAAARTNHHVPPACGIYYYEVEVLNPGIRGHISVGYSAADVPLNRLPGWEEHSWGYHGDDGHVFASEGEGKPYGPTYTSGDTIGCGIDYTLQKMFYTKNGSFLGLVFDRVGVERRLFPSVGLRTPGESVKSNFGKETFRFDINAYVYQERTRVWRTIQSLPITLTVDLRTNQSGFTPLADKANTRSGENLILAQITSSETKGKMDEIVLSYLNHHGYSKSYQALKRAKEAGRSLQRPGLAEVVPPIGEDMDLDTDLEEATAASSLREGREEQELQNRIKILKAVQSGDIDTALTETQQHFPSVLEAEGGLMKFRLRCRKLVELIIESAQLFKKIQTEKAVSSTNGHSRTLATSAIDGVFDMEMDIETVATPSTGPLVSNGRAYGLTETRGENAMEIYHQAFGKALAYGQSLQWEYRGDKREEVVNLFQRSASLLAFTDPLQVDLETGALVSHESRLELTNELNKAILAASGRPVQSTLERLYLHTCCVTRQLGLLGEGAAAFGDARREILEN